MAAVAGDQARDIVSLRLQNRTTFDWGALKLDVGGFVNAKSLYHPIFQVIDQDSLDIGGFFAPIMRRGRSRSRWAANCAAARPTRANM